jgi:hypothetical protein
MKKMLLTIALMIGLSASTYAVAMPVNDAGVQALQFANNGLQAANNGLQTANNGLQAAWKALEEGWNEARQEFEELAWVKQLKGTWEQIGEMKKTVAEIMGFRDDVMNTLSGARNLEIPILPTTGTNSVNYKYAEKLPENHIIMGSCADKGCTYSSNYIGPASGANSDTIRKSWRVSGSLTAENVNTLSHQAAEEYAHQIAVIQAMAREAYTQANNRIAIIEELQQKIKGATAAVRATGAVNKKSTAPTDGRSGLDMPTYATGATSPDSISATEGSAGDNSASTDLNKNDLKYIADLQARIQVEQALLVNDQNKLSSLAILQQSAYDAYEQRKREIAAYAINGGQDEGFGLINVAKRTVIAAGQSLAYDSVRAAYGLEAINTPPEPPAP